MKEFLVMGLKDSHLPEKELLEQGLQNRKSHRSRLLVSTKEKTIQAEEIAYANVPRKTLVSQRTNGRKGCEDVGHRSG